MSFKGFLLLLIVLALLADSSDAWGRRRRRRSGSRRRRSSLSMRVATGITSIFKPSSSCKIGSNDYPYSQDLARKMFVYCGIAYYQKEPSLLEWKCHSCRVNPLVTRFDIIASHTYSSLQLAYFVGYDPALQAVVVAIRGSDGPNVANWFGVNFRIAKVVPSLFPADSGKVHKGFNNAYNAIRNQMWAAVLSTQREARSKYHVTTPNRVYVTGHSMGGALGVFAALDLRVNRGMDVIMMSFGAPRVGDECFAAYYGRHVTKSIRVAHSLDPVTLLPPTPVLGYYHVPRYHNDRSSRFSHVAYVGYKLSELSNKRRKRRHVIITDLTPHLNKHNKYTHYYMK
eukprot:scpid49036/ scgid34404/ Lipase; Triacylglycerol lipase